MTLDPGEMRHQVTIRAITLTPDEGAGYTETPSDVATVWAAVEPLEGREQLAAMQMGMSRPHRFRVWYRSDLTGANELFHDGRRFNVGSVVDPGARREELVILADEIP